MRRDPGKGEFWIQRRQLGATCPAQVPVSLGSGAMHRERISAFMTGLTQARAGRRERVAAFAIVVGPLAIWHQGRDFGSASEAVLLRILRLRIADCGLRIGFRRYFGGIVRSRARLDCALGFALLRRVRAFDWRGLRLGLMDGL